jgi:hypothetical protein
MDRFTREHLDPLPDGSLNRGGLLGPSIPIEVENWFTAGRVGLDRRATRGYRPLMAASKVMPRIPYARRIAGPGRQLLRRLSSLALVGEGAGRTHPCVRGFQRA